MIYHRLASNINTGKGLHNPWLTQFLATKTYLRFNVIVKPCSRGLLKQLHPEPKYQSKHFPNEGDIFNYCPHYSWSVWKYIYTLPSNDVASYKSLLRDIFQYRSHDIDLRKNINFLFIYFTYIFIYFYRSALEIDK